MPKLGSFSWPGSVVVTRAIDGELYPSDGSQPPASDSPFYLFLPGSDSMQQPFSRINRDATEGKLLVFSAEAFQSRWSDFWEASIAAEEEGEA